ncbi:MAG: lamin tail domain-containing protein [Lentisphaerae bacterium]|nr:lamin tail domain-containing protein [Lentisphaerota bacterium]
MRFNATRTAHATWLSLALLGATLPATGDLVINEFMASNLATLTNSAGESPDWIELYNPTDASIDLAGWHLTDRRDNLAKWTFPGTNIPPASYLLVFASGADTPVIGSDLHANFKLDPDGEYLALVKPDGVTVASEYAPAYPDQTTDVSFGLRPDAKTVLLLSSNTPCRFNIPTDDSAGTTWTAKTFDATAWSPGAFGIGYETAPGDFASLIQTPVPDRTRGVYVRCLFEVANPDLLDELLLRVKFDDGFVAYLNGVRVAAANDPAGLRWDSSATIEQTNSDAMVFEEFDLTSFRGQLTAGTNVLAIHLLNRILNPLIPSDLLLAPELSAQSFSPGTNTVWRYFHQPTPLARNVLGALDFLRPVTFSRTRGFCSAPFSLALSTPTPGADIFYTTDSSVPTTSAGTRYLAPFPITRTTVVRARAFKPNEEPSVAQTHTYLFPSDIIAAPSMRTSITQSPVYGPGMTNALLSIPSICLATLSTAIDRTPEWPTSVEMIWPDGREGFQVNAGVARFGNYWQNFEKRMFRLYFREKYGASKLRYPLFKGVEQGLAPVEEFDQLDLKSGSQDMAARGFYMSEPFCDDAMLEMGRLAPHGRFVHVYLNGQYWGIYHLHERWEPHMLTAYLGGNPDGYESVDSEGTHENWVDEPVHPVDGDGSAWARIESLRSNYQALRAYLDVPQYLDFMLLWLTGYCEAEFRGVGPVAANAGGYKMWMKDTDGWLRGFGHTLTTPGPGGAFSGLWQEQDADYVVLKRDRIQQLFTGDGVLTPARNQARLSRRCDEIEPAFPAESARWGYRMPDTWATEKAAALARLATQTDQVLATFRAAGWYPLDAPALAPPGGVFTGAVTVTLGVTNSATIYYTLNGDDPRQAGSGAPAGRPYATPLSLTRATLLKARARIGNTWSGLQEALYVPADAGPLRVTELMAHPRAPTAAETNAVGGGAWTATDFEFIELRNTGTTPVSLVGVHVADAIDFDFTHSAVTILPPGEHVLVVGNRAAFATRYPAVPPRLVAGEFAAIANWPAKTLSDGGERVRLADGLDRTIVSFTYGNGRDWPLAADGAGHSLVPLALDDQSDALEYGGNWRASAFRDGSPGAPDPVPTRDLVVNEVAAHTDYSNAVLTDYDSNDWLELFNHTAAPIGLSGWYLSDRADNLTLWPIPAANVITAGGFIVFDEVNGFHSPITNGFGLNKAGDQVFLSYLPGDARDRVADAVRFDGQENGRSLGRAPDGEPNWVAMVPSPDASNQTVVAGVVISELMFHPPDTNGAENAIGEFIELHNPQGVTVALWNAEGPWRVEGTARLTLPAGTSLRPGERLVLVSFDPASNTAARASFLAEYGLTNDQARLVGPYDGLLSDRGGRVSLEAPLAPDLAGGPLVWVVVDDVIYFDRTPWPQSADGTGPALTRATPPHAGRDPVNWYAAPPTPGSPPARVALSAPEDGAIVFAPGPQTVQAVVESALVAEPVAQVAMLEDSHALATPTAPPYAAAWAIPGAGHYALRAELTDAAGTWTSRTVEVTALAVSNVQVEAVTDGQAIFDGQLSGDAAAEVRVYWGRVDGGTQPTAWESSALVGSVSNAGFSLRAGNLQQDLEYHVRASARVGASLGWAPQSVAFTTPGYGSWSNTARIRFDGYVEAETLRDFPALVCLGPHLAGFRYASFGGDWASLRFTDDAGGQQLPYDVDTWDTNGLSAVWVRVPALTNGAAIRAYWGRDGMTNPPPESQDGSVWRETFDGVWHGDEALDNAAAPGSPGRNSGSTATTGPVGAARAFDGVDDAVEPALDTAWYHRHLAAQSWSLWVRPAASPSSGSTVFGAGGNTNRLYIMMNTVPLVRKWSYGVGMTDRLGPAYATGVWQMVSLVLSNGTAYAQVNEGARVSLGTYGDVALTNQPVLGMRGGAGFPFAGAIDELRLAPLARSAAWLRAEYRTMGTPFAFATYEPVQSADHNPDQDADGLPDAWERLRLGDTTQDGGGDGDHDGMTDAAEYVAGTDPTNTESVLRLAIAPGPGVAGVMLPTVTAQGPGYEGLVRQYDLLATPGLAATPWEPIPDFTNIPGTDVLLIYTNPGPVAGPRFYRTRVRLAVAPP